MRLLHTSDWHLGARLGRHDRLNDQVCALRSLVEQAQVAKPDLVVHTGDLFDGTRPSHLALHVGVKALSRLSEMAPTIVLAGNHDSGQLFRALHEMAGLRTPRRLWFLHNHQVLAPPELADFAIACVPFIPPAAIADLARGEAAKFEGTYADGIRKINTALLDDAEKIAGKRGIVVYAAHLHVHGARPGKSERRITVGDDYATHIDTLQRASYAAFGHIHDPQLVPGGTVTGRYAGSLVQLDYGEASQKKVAIVVDIDDEVIVREMSLESGRPLVQFSGTVDALESIASAGEFEGAILKARVESKEPILDLADRLSEWSPNCAVFDLINTVSRRPAEPVDAFVDAETEPRLEELFREWRATLANEKQRQAPDVDVEVLFAEALGDVAGADLGASEIVSAARAALEALATRDSCDRSD